MPHETARLGREGTRLDVPSHPGEDDSPPTFNQLRGNSEIMPTRCAERRLLKKDLGLSFPEQPAITCFAYTLQFVR
jgi:hypothetical protein